MTQPASANPRTPAQQHLGAEGHVPDAVSERLEQEVRAHLNALGIHLTEEGVIECAPEDKQSIRDMHRGSVDDSRKTAEQALRDHETEFVNRLAVGSDIDVEAITPRLVPVVGKTPESLLWRWITLHWSIPTSAGYGRRLRYLVVDQAHGNAIIGAIGLGDPVFALNARDDVVGWNRQQREAHLHQLMDAFVLGAVPPYSSLIGGKLVALLAIGNRVREDFRAKYDGKIARISGKRREGPLAAITTTSALGRSSLYNRLQAPPDGDRLAYLPAGFTNGSGDFHFHGDIYRRLRDFVAEQVPREMSDRQDGWGGNSYRNRREVITRAFDLMGIDGRKMRRHGIRREVYVAPLTLNFQELLSGQQTRPRWCTHNYRETTEWWLERWAIERAMRRPEWRTFNPDTWRIWASFDNSSWPQGL